MSEKSVGVLVAVKEFSERKEIRKILEENIPDKPVMYDAYREEEIEEICHRENILLAVIDTEIADSGAIDAIKHMYVRNEKSKVIVLTDLQRISIYEQVKLSNVLNYLIRPYKEAELEEELEYAIERIKETP